MKLSREKKGQFVIIAVMFTAIMIVSIGALMHSAITYYKHEPWEEYSALIGDVEINSRRVVELCLANYTNSIQDESILNVTLHKWEKDLTEIYDDVNWNYVVTAMLVEMKKLKERIEILESK